MFLRSAGVAARQSTTTDVLEDVPDHHEPVTLTGSLPETKALPRGRGRRGQIDQSQLAGTTKGVSQNGSRGKRSPYVKKDLLFHQTGVFDVEKEFQYSKMYRYTTYSWKHLSSINVYAFPALLCHIFLHASNRFTTSCPPGARAAEREARRRRVSSHSTENTRGRAGSFQERRRAAP